MGRYFRQRTIQSALSLFGLIVLVFFLARLTGNPADLLLPVDTPQSVRDEFSARHGFDQPVLVQFGRYLVELAQLDMGYSLRDGRPALDHVLAAFPTTLLLSFWAMLISLTIAIVTGSIAAWRPGGLFDRIASLISLAGASIPNFWIAIVGVLIFAVWYRVLPTSGTGTPLHWILPVTVLFIRPCGVLTQVVRSSMIAALSAPYTKTARARGVRTRAVIFGHALRNAMLPVVTVAGDQAAGMINGAVIAETIFGFPGVGRLLIDSIMFRDFAVIQAAVMVTAIAIFILNIGIDIIYAILDPRVRHG
ncbi:MAG: ABC transporter permease [Geminicoccaceae bacterium]|nr:ABC transporter permease [Geminicoccaceae bacterium]